MYLNREAVLPSPRGGQVPGLSLLAGWAAAAVPSGPKAMEEEVSS